MTENNHPITPSPELVQQWANEYWCLSSACVSNSERYIAIQAARWGSDQELEACCEWLDVGNWKHISRILRAARRPKPKSLAEEGYDALDTYIYGNPDSGDKERTYNALRRALERLQELEGQAND